MNPSSVATLPLALLLACSAPPGRGTRVPGDGEVVRLALAPEAGATYRFRLAVDAETRDRNVRSVVAGTLVVGERSGQRIPITQHVDATTVEVLNTDVRLPPGRSEIEGARLEGAMNARGAVVGDVRVSGVPAELAPLVSTFVWGTPELPAGEVAVGEAWEASADWAFAPTNVGVRDTGDLDYHVESVGDGLAHVRIAGESTGTSQAIQGLQIRGELRIEGDLAIAIDDGLRGHGTSRGELSWSLPGASAQVDLSALPQRIGIEWCVWKDGDAPSSVGCADEAPYLILEPAEPARVARTFEGDACDARADAVRTTMQAALAATVTNLVHDGSLALPTATGGQVEDEDGMTIVVGADRYRLDGRDYTSLEELGRAVSARPQRARRATDEGQARRTPIYLVAAADLPVMRTLDVALLLRSDATEMRLAVARDAAPPPDVADGAPAELRAEVARVRDATSPTDRAYFIGNAIERSIGACPAILLRFASTANASPADKLAILARMDEDVRACRCGGLDVDALEVFLAFSLHRPNVFAWIPLPAVASDDASARTLRLSSAATVQDLATAAARAGGARPFRVLLR